MANHGAESTAGGSRQIDLIKLYRQKRCLVVDDLPEVRGSLQRILRNFGAEIVDTAANGDEAVRLCQERAFDLVLCDYNLGAGKDGQQVLEEVRHTKALPLTSLFVMLTGESSREMVLGALACQPDDYITKPFTEGSLRSRLDRALLRHQFLTPCKQALERDEPEAALAACRQAQRQPGRHGLALSRLEGQLLLATGDAAAALTRFEEANAAGTGAWAMLGRARAQVALGELDAAERELLELVAMDSRLVEAHDLLAEIHHARGQWLAAQRAMEKAVSVSPKSVHRHRSLAALAELNGEDDTAAKAHLQALRWGHNSCHESPQDYFNFVRKTADSVARVTSLETRRTLTRQAHDYLARANKRYQQQPELALQADLVRAQLAMVEGRTAEANGGVERAWTQLQAQHAPQPELVLELARALTAVGREAEARQQLAQLASQHPGDAELLRRLDGITSEPISDAGRVRAAELTRSGIKAYSEGDYAAAIEIFNQALSSYPRHVSLNLNLLQSILAATQQSGVTPQYLQFCQRGLKAVSHLPPEHPEAARASLVLRELTKHYGELGR